MKKNGFISKKECTQAVKRLEQFIKMDGDLYGEKISITTLEKAISHFERAHEMGGRYANHVLEYPHFTIKEIEILLDNL